MITHILRVRPRKVETSL